MHFEVLWFILIIVILTKNLAMYFSDNFLSSNIHFWFTLFHVYAFHFSYFSLFVYLRFFSWRKLHWKNTKPQFTIQQEIPEIPLEMQSTSTFGMSRICQNNFYFIPQMMEILKSNNYFKFLTVMSSIDWMPLSSISWTWKLGKLMINLLWISVTQACKSL